MYYKLGQACVTNWGGFVLLQIRANVTTSWGSFIVTNQSKCCYKLAQLLQIRATVITKQGSYYKLGQNLLQIRAIITNWVITGLINFLKSTLQSSISIKYIKNYSKCVNASKLLRSSYSYHYFLCKCFAEMSLKAYNVLQKSE